MQNAKGKKSDKLKQRFKNRKIQINEYKQKMKNKKEKQKVKNQTKQLKNERC